MKNVINVIIGIFAMVIFLIVNLFIMPLIGQSLFWGDTFTISYHMFTYTGLILLCGIMIVCTCIIVEKLNEVKNAINKSKELTINKSNK